MRTQGLLFSLFIAICPFSHAQDDGAPQACRFTAELHGDPDYFWLWGRDAWSGTGLVECREDLPVWRQREDLQWPVRIPVSVRYQSLVPGFGADRRSRVTLEIPRLNFAQVPALWGAFRTLGQRLENDTRKFSLVVQGGDEPWIIHFAANRLELDEAMQFGLLTLTPSETLP